MSILAQRIRARDWQNVSKIEGRSVDAVRARYDDTYAPVQAISLPAASATAEPKPAYRLIIDRLIDLDWSRSDLAAAARVDAKYLRAILNGKTPMTAEMARRIGAALDLAEAMKRCAA